MNRFTTFILSFILLTNSLFTMNREPQRRRSACSLTKVAFLAGLTALSGRNLYNSLTTPPITDPSTLPFMVGPNVRTRIIDGYTGLPIEENVNAYIASYKAIYGPSECELEMHKLDIPTLSQTLRLTCRPITNADIYQEMDRIMSSGAAGGVRKTKNLINPNDLME